MNSLNKVAKHIVSISTWQKLCTSPSNDDDGWTQNFLVKDSLVVICVWTLTCRRFGLWLLSPDLVSQAVWTSGRCSFYWDPSQFDFTRRKLCVQPLSWFFLPNFARLCNPLQIQTALIVSELHNRIDVFITQGIQVWFWPQEAFFFFTSLTIIIFRDSWLSCSVLLMWHAISEP